VDEQLKPGIWPQSGLEYSGDVHLPVGLDPTLRALCDAAADLGLYLKEETDGRLVFRETIHGLSWPIRVEASVLPRHQGTGVWVLGTCPRFSFPGLDFAYLKGLTDKFMRQVETVAAAEMSDGQASVDASAGRMRMRAWERRLTLIQRVPLALLGPAILVSFFGSRELDAAVWLLWVWLVGVLMLAVEIVRRQVIGVESKQYVGITVVWSLAALGFTLFYVL
jgi:hypothetical protein